MTIRIEAVRDLSTLRGAKAGTRETIVMFASTLGEARAETRALNKVWDTYPMIEARFYDAKMFREVLHTTGCKPMPVETIRFR